jgi:hypothetical protein
MSKVDVSLNVQLNCFVGGGGSGGGGGGGGGRRGGGGGRGRT